MPSTPPATPLHPDAVAALPRPAGKINLNAGTLSPTPRPVLGRAAELRAQLATDPSDFCWRQTPPLLTASRAALARELNVPADELLLLPNVTFAVNLVVSSLNLLRGTELLLTDHDYGAMTTAWHRWAETRDWSVRTLALPAFGPSLTKAELLASIADALTPATRVLFLYHCTSPTGLVLPLAEICALAREREIVTVIDGAHAPGMIPCDLAAIGADFYCANLHKWLMCPAGAGFLHVSRRRRGDLKPLITSWGFGYPRSEAFDDSGNGGQRWQWDLEFHGTADRVPQMVIPEALAFRSALAEGTGLSPDAALRAHSETLLAHARRVIPLPCRTPHDPALRGALAVFEVPPCDPIAIRDRLYQQYHVEAPITLAAGKHYLRVSLAPHNTVADLDALAAAVRAIWPEARQGDA